MLWWGTRHRSETLARLQAAFPSALADDVRSALRVLPKSPYSTDLSSDDIATVGVRGETLHIPYRVYLPEPDPRATRRLTAVQRLVLQAVLSRSSDGFVRERAVRELVAAPEPWIAPFVVQLLAEYVIEIAEAIEVAAVPDAAVYVEFARANPKYWEGVRARMISYWSYYYRRRITCFVDYPAYRAASALGIWTGRMPRVRRRTNKGIEQNATR